MNNTIPTQVLEQPRVKLLGREQAILEFNRRVLAQAQREDVPLLERLRYICIVSSNLDEFFEVRYADVMEASRTPGTGINPASSHALLAVLAERGYVVRHPTAKTYSLGPALVAAGRIAAQRENVFAAERTDLAEQFADAAHDPHFRIAARRALARFDDDQVVAIVEPQCQHQ